MSIILYFRGNRKPCPNNQYLSLIIVLVRLTCLLISKTLITDKGNIDLCKPANELNLNNLQNMTLSGTNVSVYDCPWLQHVIWSALQLTTLYSGNLTTHWSTPPKAILSPPPTQSAPATDHGLVGKADIEGRLGGVHAIGHGSFPRVVLH